MYISYHHRIFFLNAMKKVHKIICQKRLAKLHFQNKTWEKD